jgi:hypothetical protein
VGGGERFIKSKEDIEVLTIKVGEEWKLGGQFSGARHGRITIGTTTLASSVKAELMQGILK